MHGVGSDADDIGREAGESAIEVRVQARVEKAHLMIIHDAGCHVLERQRLEDGGIFTTDGETCLGRFDEQDLHAPHLTSPCFPS